MMDNETLRSVSANALIDFTAYRLLDGLYALSSLAAESCCQDGIASEVQTLRDNYAHMLSFLSEQANDEGHHSIQESIAHDGIRLTLQASRAIRIKNADDTYARAFHYLINTYGTDFNQAILDRWQSHLTPEEQADAQDDLFDLIWTSPQWTSHDTAEWYDFLSQQLPMVRLHLLGGILLSAWEYFDAEKLLLLSLYCNSDDKRTEAQALTSLILLFLHHHSLQAFFKPFAELFQRKSIRKHTTEAIHELLLMMVAEKENRLEEEELSALTKGLSLENMLNVEYFQKMLAIKAKYLKRSMKRGLDPNFSKIGLLHSCPFLKRISHWFMPFDKGHQLFQKVMIDKNGNEKQSLSRMLDVIYDCDVDLMVMLYMMSTDDKMDGIADKLESEGDKLSLGNGDLPDKSYPRVVQNLYRFFVHSSLHPTIGDPFHDKHTFFDVPMLIGCLDDEYITQMFGLLNETENYEAVRIHAEQQIARNGASAGLLAELGTAYLHLHKYREAISCLQRCDMLAPDNEATLILLEHCYEKLGRISDKLECMQRRLELNPSDEKLRMDIPLTMVADRRYEEALALLFRIDYDHPDDQATCTAIARASFMTGKHDVANRYLTKLLEMGNVQTWPLLLMQGHIFFLQGDWQKAAHNYCLFADAYMDEEKVDEKATLCQFESERSILSERLIAESDIQLMRDIIGRHIYDHRPSCNAD